MTLECQTDISLLAGGTDYFYHLFVFWGNRDIWNSFRVTEKTNKSSIFHSHIETATIISLWSTFGLYILRTSLKTCHHCVVKKDCTCSFKMPKTILAGFPRFVKNTFTIQRLLQGGCDALEMERKPCN